MTHEAVIRFAQNLSVVIGKPVKVIRGKEGRTRMVIDGWTFWFTHDDGPCGGYDGWESPEMKPGDIPGEW